MRQRSVGVLSALALAAVAATSGVAACGPAARDPAVAVPPAMDGGQPPTVVQGAASAQVDAAAKAPAADAGAMGPALCGCSLCEPVFSEDACGSDSDCAPATACHAERCVAAAKSPPRDPNLMCTRILKCGTTDANGCRCISGRCALAPHPKN